MSAADQHRALRFASALADAYGHLPEAHYEVSRGRPEVVTLSVHDFATFERWREALDIEPNGVLLTCGPSVAYMRGSYESTDGITVELTGYSSALPAVAL